MNSISAFLLIVNVLNIVLKINTQSCNYGTYFDGHSCKDCGILPNSEWVDQVDDTYIGQQTYLKTWFSSIVRIAYKDVYICSGVLISERTVLTAASCIFKDPNPVNYKVAYGETFTYYKFGYVNKIIIVMHENYDNVNKLNDIAVLNLQNKITVGQYATITCLPNFPNPFPSDFYEPVTSGGWEEENRFVRHSIPNKMVDANLQLVDPSKHCSDLNSQGAPSVKDIKSQLCISLY